MQHDCWIRHCNTVVVLPSSTVSSCRGSHWRAAALDDVEETSNDIQMFSFNTVLEIVGWVKPVHDLAEGRVALRYIGRQLMWYYCHTWVIPPLSVCLMHLRKATRLQRLLSCTYRHFKPWISDCTPEGCNFFFFFSLLLFTLQWRIRLSCNLLLLWPGHAVLEELLIPASTVSPFLSLVLNTLNILCSLLSPRILSVEWLCNSRFA